jgi:pyruvate dehydrogenase E1 component alpha subunit
MTGDVDVPPVEVTKELLLHMFTQMVRIRRVEELAAKAYTLRKIRGFCHLYIGMEPVAVGATAALRPDDPIIAAYRIHGQVMARGATPREVMCELFGKGNGITKGVGGSMHMASERLHFWGGYGIVGGHVPLAAGAAFAARYNGEDKVSLCYFGDGAAHQGAFFEALALSQLWRLPAVFLCENNYYAMGTSLDRQSYLTDMSRRGDGVGMRRWQFEAFDVVDVYRNVKAAADWARAGNGPVILEGITYRYRGHSMSDPAKYRPEGELEEKRKKDGIQLAEQRLKDEHGVTDAEIEAIRARIEEEAQDAYTFADQSPEPDPADLYRYTYAE